MKIIIAKTPADIEKTWEAVSLLRPHLQKEQYGSLMQEMFTSGYQLAYAEEDNRAVSVIGYRHLHFLFNGKHIYIDDLSTLEAYRGRGYASQLIDYIIRISKEKGYEMVTLDSGSHRHDAQRLYMNKGFIIHGYHFVRKL